MIVPPARPACGLELAFGMASETGRRAQNEDFVGACPGSDLQRATHGMVAAIADGIGGARGGRVAAEVTVRHFLEGYYQMPALLGVRRAGAAVLQSLNSWVHALGRSDPLLDRMGCTFSALILRGRSAHLLHVGDSRIYRLAEGHLTCLTRDHCLAPPDQSHVLFRAIGIEDSVKLDYAALPLGLHDRFLLCSDGVHGSLSAAALRTLLTGRSAPDDSARAIVAAALAAGSQDNASALVVDVLRLPPVDAADLFAVITPLPVIEPPSAGAVIDGFMLEKMISDGRNSRLFLAQDSLEDRRVVVKFPRTAGDEAVHRAFVREAWVAARINSPWIGSVLALAERRASCLYSVMPYYDGETLERRCKRQPPLTLAEGVALGISLGRGLATLHRAGVVHQDVKPANILLLRDGGVKLIDLGIARLPGLEDGETPLSDRPGTASYMAPELFAGGMGCAATDLFALAVTLFQGFTGRLPYGEIEAFSHPRFGSPLALARLRPDLPAWLGASLARAMAINPAERQADLLEFVLELENAPLQALPMGDRRRPLYERNPLLFWQCCCAILAVGLMAALCRH